MPLYYVEMRAPDVDQTVFINGRRLRAVEAHFGTAHSTIFSFTPEAGFNCRNPYGSFDCDYLNQVKFVNGRSRLRFYIESTAGIPVTADNSGIRGRTEVLLGTMRVRVGPAITDKDRPDRKLVFDITQGDDPTLATADVTVWTSATGYMALGAIPRMQQMQWFSEPELEGIAPGDGDGAPPPPPPPPPPVPPIAPPGPSAACDGAQKGLAKANAKVKSASKLATKQAKEAKKAAKASKAKRAKARARAKSAATALKRAKTAQSKAKKAAAKACET